MRLSPSFLPYVIAAAICSAISILLRSGMTTDRWPLSFRRPAAAECEPCVVLLSSRLLSDPAGQGLDCLVRRFTTGLRGRPHSRILSAHLCAFGCIRQRSQLNLAASLKLRPWRGHSFLQLLRSGLTPCSLHHARACHGGVLPFIHDGGRGGGPRLIVRKPRWVVREGDLSASIKAPRIFSLVTGLACDLSRDGASPYPCNPAPWRPAN
jgi:hypothetical protein